MILGSLSPCPECQVSLKPPDVPGAASLALSVHGGAPFAGLPELPALTREPLPHRGAREGRRGLVTTLLSCGNPAVPPSRPIEQAARTTPKELAAFLVGKCFYRFFAVEKH